MKIALIHTTLPNPGRNKEGGVTVFVHRLSNHLVAAGHSVTVFSSDPAPLDAAYEVRNLPVPAWMARSFAARTLLLPWLLYRLDLHEFDVVHTHGDDAFFWSRKRVRSLHGSALGELKSATRLRRRVGQAVLYPLEILAAVTARRAIAQSSSAARHFPFAGDRVNYAVDTDVFHPGPKSARPSVLFVGTIDGRKRGRLLCEAFTREIKPKVPDAELWLVAEQEVAGEGVTSFGRVDDDRLAELYRAAWVFCLPSSYEGFGLPYLEAFASGTPVVASTNPGALEVSRNGTDAVIVSDDSLASNIIRLLGSQAERADLAERGLRRAGEYSWSDAVAGYERVYRSVRG